jgi:hypothetical protein
VTQCDSCAAQCVIAWPYFIRVGKTVVERHFCDGCERAYRMAKAQRTPEPALTVAALAPKPQRRKPESLPFAMQLEETDA